ISPQNFISEEFKEQRSNTVISVLGTIFGYYSVMMALYSFLFNPDKITLEDLLEKFKRKKKENDETNNTEIPTPGQVEVFPTISRATSSSNLTRLTQEQPAMISTLSTITSLPVPDIYLAYNGTFTITCTKGSSSIGNKCLRSVSFALIIDCLFQHIYLTQNVSKEGDCNDYVTQPTRGDNPNLQYAGKFLPKDQISLFPKGIGNYDPWIEGSVAHTNNENEELFTESLGYANRYYLSGGLDYHLTYSRKVRKTIANTNLNFIGLSIGLETDYNTQNYIESKMQIFPKDDLNSPFIKLEISPQNFISEEFKEQRSNTVISILGTIFGYYGSDKITPEGLVEFKCRGFKKKINDTSTVTSIAASSSSLTIVSVAGSSSDTIENKND
ncbi:251_t:CDS:10, partial [Entrophospora sp. SA101]